MWLFPQMLLRALLKVLAFVYGNTNSGSSYWVSPEGEKFTLTWTADESGFQPKGDHLPVAPALPYHRTGAGNYNNNMY